MDKKQIVLDTIAEVGGIDVAELKPETELVAQLGLDSAKAVQLLVLLEERLSIEIEDEQVPKLITVGDVLNAVDRVLA